MLLRVGARMAAALCTGRLLLQYGNCYEIFSKTPECTLRTLRSGPIHDVARALQLVFGSITASFTLLMTYKIS